MNVNDFFTDFTNFFDTIFGNIFEFLVLIGVIALAASLIVLLVSKGNKGVSYALTSFIAIVLCVLFDYLIFGEFPSLPPFLQFIEEWIRQLINLF
ncbi:MAG: hypothetical protein ACTSPY_02530 [Candidatus Helarchaeota archaeon]